MAGWVGIDDVGMPGPIYLRFRPASDGRLRVIEVYLDAGESPNGVSLADLKGLPLTRIEAFVNANADPLLTNITEPGPDLSTLASYFRTSFNPATWGDERNKPTWVATSFMAQVPHLVKDQGGPVVQRARKVSSQWLVVGDDGDFVLDSGPTADGLTDDFLRSVARAYSAALTRRERPNMAIARQTGCPPKSVQRWVYTARQRGIMPRGRKGQAG